MKTAIVMFMSALHQGCINFINRNKTENTTLFLIGSTLAKAADPEREWVFEKHLNGIPALEMQKFMNANSLVTEIKILDENNLKDFDQIIIPVSDGMVEKVMKKYYPNTIVIPKEGFIRWEKKTVLSQKAPVAHAIVSVEDFDKEIMSQAFKEAKKSWDWWRQVAAIIFPKNNMPIVAINRHMPDEQAPYTNGDPRSEFKPGEYIEYSTAIHAEMAAMGFALREGICLKDAVIYVTAFPCPNCTRMIIEAGIKTVYYCEGYSLLDGAEIFNAARVKLIFVDVPEK